MNALRSVIVSIPSTLFPTWFTEATKREIKTMETGITNNTNKRIEKSKRNPTSSLMKKRGIQQSIGCKRAERIWFFRLTEDSVKNVINLRINTKEKPRRYIFNQRYVFPMNTLKMVP
jgi:hypothetical protein